MEAPQERSARVGDSERRREASLRTRPGVFSESSSPCECPDGAMAGAPRPSSHDRTCRCRGGHGRPPRRLLLRHRPSPPEHARRADAPRLRLRPRQYFGGQLEGLSESWHESGSPCGYSESLWLFRVPAAGFSESLRLGPEPEARMLPHATPVASRPPPARRPSGLGSGRSPAAGNTAAPPAWPQWRPGRPARVW